MQISPDGKWVAYTVSSVDVAADKSDTDVWMASWDGTEQIRLTSSPESENAPRWSPDGQYLAFLSGRPGKSKGTQIWLLNRMGGEAQQFTDFKNKLSSYEWSPDSKRLLLTMTERDPADSDDEKPAAAPNAKAPETDRRGSLQVQAGHPGIPDAKARPLLLVRHGIEEGRGVDRRRISKWHRHPGRRTGNGSHSSAKKAKTPSATTPGIVYVVETRVGATPRQITTTTACMPSASRAQPEWSPDGKRLVYLESVGAKNSAYNMSRLAVVAVDGGAPKLLADKLDRAVSSPRFTPDGASILFLVSDDRSEYPARILGERRRGGTAASRSGNCFHARRKARTDGWPCWPRTMRRIRKFTRSKTAVCAR